MQVFRCRNIDKRPGNAGKRFLPKAAKSQEAQGEEKGRPKDKVKRGPPLQRGKHVEYGAFRKTFYPFSDA